MDFLKVIKSRSFSRLPFCFTIHSRSSFSGVQDLTDRFERPMKYLYFEHAERNAIFTAARHGIRTEGATLYVQALPCVDCAR